MKDLNIVINLSDSDLTSQQIQKVKQYVYDKLKTSLEYELSIVVTNFLHKAIEQIKEHEKAKT